MATVDATEGQALIVRAGDVEAGHIQGQNIQIKEVGQRVIIGKYMYCRTNFYIEQSRKYVGKQKLTKYFYVKWLHWLYILIFFGSLVAPLHYIATFVMFGVNLLVFMVYTQNMYVNFTTMWYVLKQPSLPDSQLPQNNVFIEMQLNQYEARYAACSRAGIGFVQRSTTQHKVEIQVFRNSAIRLMKNCVRVSSVCFVGSLLMFLYCYTWGILLLLIGSY